MKRLPNKVKLK